MKKNWLFIFLLMVLLQFACILLPFLEENVPGIQVTATQELVLSPETLEETPTVAAPVPTETQVPSTATPTSTPRATDESYEETIEDIYIFEAQDGSPMRIQAWTHECNWLGVAGQVFNLDGTPINNLVVEGGGEINGQPILGLALTGRSSPYGEGGYELKLLDAPETSKDTVWVQLKDAGGNTLSPKIFLETADVCDQNLVLVNFVVNEAIQGNTLYIPLIQP